MAVTSFAEMVRSVTMKLYELDSTIIERMARSNEHFPGWVNPAFSYDSSKVRGNTKIQGTDIYLLQGFSADGCIWFIKGLLNSYELNIEEDFYYSARTKKSIQTEEE